MLSSFGVARAEAMSVSGTRQQGQRMDFSAMIRSSIGG